MSGEGAKMDRPPRPTPPSLLRNETSTSKSEARRQETGRVQKHAAKPVGAETAQEVRRAHENEPKPVVTVAGHKEKAMKTSEAGVESSAKYAQKGTNAKKQMSEFSSNKTETGNENTQTAVSNTQVAIDKVTTAKLLDGEGNYQLATHLTADGETAAHHYNLLAALLQRILEEEMGRQEDGEAPIYAVFDVLKVAFVKIRRVVRESGRIEKVRIPLEREVMTDMVTNSSRARAAGKGNIDGVAAKAIVRKRKTPDCENGCLGCQQSSSKKCTSA